MLEITHTQECNNTKREIRNTAAMQPLCTPLRKCMCTRDLAIMPNFFNLLMKLEIEDWSPSLPVQTYQCTRQFQFVCLNRE